MLYLLMNQENGIKNTAIVIVGRENGAEFTAGLTGLNYKILECDGRIRENITIHPSSGKETRLSFKGFECMEDMLCKILKMIEGNYLSLNSLNLFSQTSTKLSVLILP